MNVHLGIHVVISLAVEDIYLHRTDPASEAAAILNGNKFWFPMK
jgi:hypothetical protein